MSFIKQRLTILTFLQFFVWGAWLISIGDYAIKKLDFSGAELGSIFSTFGLASFIMPGILGILSDRFISAEKLYGICHLIGGFCLFYCGNTVDKEVFLTLMMLNAFFYMPTISLNFTVSYAILENKNYDLQKDFAPIRVWGTVGFISAMWLVDLNGWVASANQFYLASAAAFCLGFYAFTLPTCKVKEVQKNKNWKQTFGLDALVLFKQSNMAIFFIFCIFLGVALQITNMLGSSFLSNFGNNPIYRGSFVVKFPLLTLSISQISESLFILAIPFFLKRFGIKKVMLLSFAAWVLRFALFGIGNPGAGLPFLIASMIIYGMAFDFFNISGSLFIEKETNSNIRGSAQGIFMMMTNGLGSILGGWFAGSVVDYNTINKVINWQNCWFVFAIYALITGLLFMFLFKIKSNSKKLTPQYV